MNVNVQKLFTLDGHQDCVYTLEEGIHENMFYSGAGDGMVVSWDLKNPEHGELIAKMRNSVYAIHLARKDVLVAGQNFEGIHFIDLHTKKEIGSLKIAQSQIFDIKSMKNRLFVGTGDGTLYVVDADELAIKKRVKLGDKSIRSIAVNTSLGEMAVGMSDNSIRILALDDYRQKYSIHAHKLSVFSVVYNPINQHLISASRDARLKTWNSTDHYGLERSVVAHMYAINSLSISPDYKYFVTGSMDKSIKVWDLNAFKLLKVIDRSRHAGHATSVNKVLWTRHQNQILSCSDDKKISVWDLSFI